MLIVGIFLAAFCFSLLVEAIQTLVHIDHQDTMHHPVAVFALGCGGLMLNGICFLLIGGYTYHQGSFLHITSSGDVVLDRVVSGEGLRRGSRRLSKTKRGEIIPTNLQSSSSPSPAIISSTASIQLDTTTTASTTSVQKIQPKPRTHTINEILRDISSKFSFARILYSFNSHISKMFLYLVNTIYAYYFFCHA